MSAAMRQQRVKGESLLSEATKKLQSRTWFASSTERRNEEAAELYERAANAFRVGSAMDEGGDAYMKAGEIYRNQLNNTGEASRCLMKAGACYKSTNPTEAIKTYRSAITLLCDAGRLTQAAKLSKEVAELFENGADGDGDGEGNDTNDQNVTLAIESYDRAAELFAMENQTSSANQCLAHVAELCSAALSEPDLIRASSIYDELGRKCLESNLLKYNAKGYFLQCVLCNLAGNDAVGAGQSLRKFESLDYTFGESREGKFACELVEAVDAFDSEMFATACFEYDRISKLDPWKTSILVKVKRGIDGGGDVGGDDPEEDDVDLT